MCIRDSTSPTKAGSVNGVRDIYKTQSHGIWNCHYNVIIAPRFRWHVLFVPIAKEVVAILKKLATRKDCTVLHDRFDRDHIQLTLSIPPKLAVTSVIQYLKSSSSLKVHSIFVGTTQKSIVQDSIWSRGYCVTTCEIDRSQIGKFTAEQWEIDRFFDGPTVDLDWNSRDQKM